MKLSPYLNYQDSGSKWFGKIPSHWEIHKQRHVVDLLVSNVDKHSVKGELPVLLCNYSDVYNNRRITRHIHFMQATATPDEIQRFQLQTGDVLITKDSEAWDDIGVPAVVEFTSPDLLCGYHLAILRPHNSTVLGSYLHWAIRSQGVATQYYVSANGVTRYGLKHSSIKNVLVPVPPIGEQAAIARFLDYINRRIDRYIQAKRKLITLLEEQRQAVIQKTVTRGLDSDVPLKPSGIDWLGDIPAHWELIRIKYLLKQVDIRSTTGQETLLSLRMNHGIVPHDEHFTRPGQAESLIGYKVVEPGQVVLNKLQANNGLVFTAKISGVVSPDYAVFDDIRGDNLDYLTTLFRTPLMKYKFRVESKGLGTGTAGFLRLYTDRFGMIPVAVPPKNEQDDIMKALDVRLKKLQDSAIRVQREIDLINEYRARLITDVVTGKLDVLEVASNLPQEEENDGFAPSPAVAEIVDYEDSEEVLADDAD